MGLTRIKAEQISDIDYKQAVRAIQTTNVTLAGGAPSQVDGVNLMKNDRVLVAGQNTGSENGLYYVATLGTGSNGTWARTSDANQTGEIEAGMIVMVTEGTTYADTQWKLTTNDPIVIGTTPLTFVINILSSVGGSNTQIQYNSAGTLAGSPNLTWDGSQLYVGATANIGGNVLPAANVTYSLGSTSARWNDLWIANSSIYIGDVVLATTGSALTINGANVLTGNAGAAFSTTGNVTGGNLLTSGQVSATGNITGGNITGTLLTGTLATAAQPNVTSLGTLTSLNSGAISSSGNVTGANILTGGLISATGNITGGNLSGTNITGTLTTAAQPNITSVGALGNLTVSGNLVVANANATSFNIATTNANIANVANVQSWTYANASFSVATQDTEPRGIFFKPDGTRMYVASNSGDRINQYDLSTPWSVTTAVYGNAYVVSAQDATPIDLFIDSTGNRMYVLGASNDRVYQYGLSSAWDVGTASSVANVSVATEETDPQALYFKPDGTRMFVLGTIGDDVNQYDLSVAWDITTAVYSKVSTAVSTFESSPQGMSFSADGTKMWIVGSSFSRIIEYLLPTPWDVGTITFNGYVNVSQIGTFQILGTSGLFVSTANNVAYVSDYQNDRIFQLSTDIPATMVYGNIFNTQLDMVVGQNLTVNQAFRVNGTIYSTGTATLGAASSTNYASGSSTSNISLLTGSTTGSINFGTGLTTGALVAGGTAQTGAITLGQSTGNFTLNLSSGATANTGTKSINIGTNGVAASNTTITIGSAVANANVNTTLHGNVTVSDTLNQASARTSFRLLNGTRYMFLNANLSGGSYNNMTSTGDTGLIFSSGVQGNASLIIAPWASATSGIRIDSVSNVANIRMAATTIQFDGNVTNGQANGVGNIGNSTGYFNTVFAKATSAQYADVAEKYVADRFYPPGTVMEIGGAAEVQATTSYASTRIAGVVSTAPALIMNSTQSDANAVELALLGRVPCRVTGNIDRGDLLTSSDRPGVATALAAQDYRPGSVIGKALEGHRGRGEGMIEVMVGRL